MHMVSTTQIIGQSPASAEPGAAVPSQDPVAAEEGTAEASATTVAKSDRPALDPTRYGDWEKNGRCIDF